MEAVVAEQLTGHSCHTAHACTTHAMMTLCTLVKRANGPHDMLATANAVGLRHAWETKSHLGAQSLHT